MRELAVQRLIIDLVRGHNGAAIKLAHRFLVGVPDLLVKLPGSPAAILEVKLNHLLVRSTVVRPSVTPLQWKFLKLFAAAGMTTGVVSIVYDGDYVGAWVGMKETINESEYLINRKMDRKAVIWSAVFQYLQSGGKQ